MVSEKLRSGQEGGFHPQGVVAEEEVIKASVVAKVLARVFGLALPVSRRSHTGQRAGVVLLQATQSIEEVAPLEAITSLRDVVCVSGMQAEPIQSVDAVHET